MITKTIINNRIYYDLWNFYKNYRYILSNYPEDIIDGRHLSSKHRSIYNALVITYHVHNKFIESRGQRFFIIHVYSHVFFMDIL